MKFLFALIFFLRIEAVAQRCSVKKVFLEIWQNSQENTCARVSFLIKLQALACNVIKNETLAQTLSCEFREIFKNNFFTENLRTTAFVMASFWKKLKVHQLVTLILMISREQGYEKKF